MKYCVFLSLFLIGLSTSAQVPNYVPTDGLVGWYPFNGNANDESGNGNNGTVNGATLTQDRFGAINSAYSFDGVDDRISLILNNNSVLNYSISVWFNSQSAGNGPFVHIGQDNGSNPFCDGFSFGQGGSTLNNDGVDLIGSYSCVGYYDSNIPSMESVWNHAVMVKAGNSLEFFLNGASVFTTNASGLVTPSNFGFIGSTSAGFSTLFSGLLDDVGLWNRALSIQEVQNLYTSEVQNTQCLPSSVPLNGLVVYYPFCGNANDESGNGNNGTVNGATLTQDRFGAINSAYSFDGVNDYINVPYNISLHGEEGTINAWVKSDGLFTSQKVIFTQSNGRPQLVAASQGVDGTQVTRKGSINWKSTSGIYPGTQSVTNVDESEWIMITGYYSSSEFRIYINGVLESSSPTLLNQDNCSNSDFQIGGLNPTNTACGNELGFSQMFKGIIDDIGVWNRALTEAEIQQLYFGCSLTAIVNATTTTTICAGESVVLNANTGANYTYQWYLNGNPISGATSSSYTAFTGGAYTVQVSDGLGCSDLSDPTTVSVNASPSVNIIGSASLTLCSGQSIVINATASGATSYQWSLNGNPISGATSLSITISAAGSYTLTATNSTNCSSISGTLVVTTSNLATPIVTVSPSNTICQGNTATLSTPLVDGYNYQWKNNGNNIAGATSNTYAASAAGNYTVTITNGFGCSSTSLSQTISVYPNPVISGIFNQGPNVVCEGSPTLFTSISSGATAYQWNLNNNPIIGANATTYTAFQGGTYTLTVTNQNGCSATSNGLTFEVLPQPTPSIVPSINYVYTGTTASFGIAGADGATAYQWQTNPLNTGWINVPNNVTYSGGTSSNLNVNEVSVGGHLQPFQVTVSNGYCEGTSSEAYIFILDTCVNTVTVYDTIYTAVTDTLIIDVTFVGVEEPNNENTILIYPNPTSDHITIDYGNIDLMNGYSLSIFNPMGQLVHASNITDQSEYIDVNAWGSAGVYQVVISDPQGNTVSTKQIVLQ